MLSGYENLADMIETKIIYNVLTMYLKAGTCGSNVMAVVSVPETLNFVGAMNGAQVTVDGSRGSISASDYGQIMVGSVFSNTPVSFDASSNGAISVSDGSVGYLSVSASSGA